MDRHPPPGRPPRRPQRRAAARRASRARRKRAMVPTTGRAGTPACRLVFPLFDYFGGGATSSTGAPSTELAPAGDRLRAVRTAPRARLRTVVEREDAVAGAPPRVGRLTKDDFRSVEAPLVVGHDLPVAHERAHVLAIRIHDRKLRRVPCRRGEEIQEKRPNDAEKVETQRE